MKNPRTPILYLTRDGLTDPLGRSQVLPYVTGLADRGFEMHVLSFEKPAQLATERTDVEALCAKHGIKWHTLDFTSRPPVLGGVWDTYRMSQAARRIAIERGIQLTHCRSYFTSVVGLKLHRELGIPFVFDMRAFWADERVEGGAWRLSNPIYGAVYSYYKRQEDAFVRNAAAVVSLTRAGTRAMQEWPSFRAAKPATYVIPCAADFSHFTVATVDQRATARQMIGVSDDRIVFVHHGSIASSYVIDGMLSFIAKVISSRPATLFVVTPDLERARAALVHPDVPPSTIVIRSASRAQIPALLAAADVGVFFIRPTFSKLSSSPTKLGELFASGIPVITNAGVGDVAEDVAELRGGIVVPDPGPKSMSIAANRVNELIGFDRAALRDRSVKRYGLLSAVDEYERLYAAALAKSPN